MIPLAVWLVAVMALQIPPVTVRLDLSGQPLAVTISGEITTSARKRAGKSSTPSSLPT